MTISSGESTGSVLQYDEEPEQKPQPKEDGPGTPETEIGGEQVLVEAETTVPPPPPKFRGIAVPPAPLPAKFPYPVDPRQRAILVRRGKWSLIAGLLCLALFTKMLAWHYWEPLNYYLNDGRPAIEKVTGQPGNPYPYVFALKIPPGMDASQFPNNQDLLKIGIGNTGFVPMFKAAYLQNPTTADTRMIIPKIKNAKDGQIDYPLMFKWLRPGEVPREKTWYWGLNVSLLCSILAVTCLLRVLFSRWFGSVREPADALRDWVVAGVVSFFLYFGIEQARRAIGLGPTELLKVDRNWYLFALPNYFLSALGGYWIAFKFAISKEGLLPSKVVNSHLSRNGNQTTRAQGLLIQSLLTTLLVGVLDAGVIDSLMRIPSGYLIMGVATVLLIGTALLTILHAWNRDRALQRVQGGTRGVLLPNKPLELNITMVGGQQSGKSVFLAAAHWQCIGLAGEFRITPMALKIAGKNIIGDENSDLLTICTKLYNGRKSDEDLSNLEAWFPKGTASVREYRFQLTYQREGDEVPLVLANFNLVDYPGGSISPENWEQFQVKSENGNVPLTSEEKQEIVDRIFRRFQQTDAVLLVMDMAKLRRSRTPEDIVEMRGAWAKVRRHIIDVSGRQRVVPLAVVRTKCDEFADLSSGSGAWDEEKINQYARTGMMRDMVTDWEKDCAFCGPKISRVAEFNTSAITNSEPQDVLGFDSPLPYRPYQPPTPQPDNCLPPFLWLITETLRWNVTPFTHLMAFLVGSSSLTLRQQEAQLKLEELLQDPKMWGGGESVFASEENW